MSRPDATRGRAGSARPSPRPPTLTATPTVRERERRPAAAGLISFHCVSRPPSARITTRAANPMTWVSSSVVEVDVAESWPSGARCPGRRAGWGARCARRSEPLPRRRAGRPAPTSRAKFSSSMVTGVVPRLLGPPQTRRTSAAGRARSGGGLCRDPRAAPERSGPRQRKNRGHGSDERTRGRRTADAAR